MTWKLDDGGRKAAGYKGDVRDCVVRAIAIAACLPYSEVYESLAGYMKQEKLKRNRGIPRNGVPKGSYAKYLSALGWRWVPTMFVGQGCKVHLKKEELPKGRLIVSVSKHVVAVIDGVIHDTYDPSRNGTRCVYGYYERT